MTLSHRDENLALITTFVAAETELKCVIEFIEANPDVNVLEMLRDRLQMREDQSELVRLTLTERGDIVE